MPKNYAKSFRSVREICAPDYKNDQKLLDSWCSNKTPENLRKWISDEKNYFIVGVDDGSSEVVGAGMIGVKESWLYMCYIVPEALGKGVGKLILDDLLSTAKANGSTKMGLESTLTAKNFYLRNGFEVVKENLRDEIPSYKMERSI